MFDPPAVLLARGSGQEGVEGGDLSVSRLHAAVGPQGELEGGAGLSLSLRALAARKARTGDEQ